MDSVKLTLRKKERGPYPPTVIDSTVTNAKFVVDGHNWIEVSVESTFAEALEIYEQATKGKLQLVLKPQKDLPARQWEVQSSNLKDKYTVRLWDDVWACDCLGYQFRHKDCRHILEVKAKLNIT